MKTKSENKVKYRIRTYNTKIFLADILWLSGHFLKVLSEKLEKRADKIQGIK